MPPQLRVFAFFNPQAVVGPRSPLVGMSAREAQARRHLRAWGEFAVIAPRAPVGNDDPHHAGAGDGGRGATSASPDAHQEQAAPAPRRAKRGTLNVEDWVAGAVDVAAFSGAYGHAVARGASDGDLLRAPLLPAEGGGGGGGSGGKGRGRGGSSPTHGAAMSARIRAGDVLLLEAGTSAKLNWGSVHDALKEGGGDRPDFLLARTVANSKPPRVNLGMDRFRVAVAVAALATMVSLSAFKVTSLLVAALLAGGLMVAVKAVTVEEALAAVKGRVLLAIVTTFGVGTAFQKTGAAHWIAQGLITLFTVSLPWGSAGALIAIALVASIVGCVVSNNAVVILMYPICATIAEEVPGVNLKQLLAVLMIGASSSFLSPVSYQTNLMVMKPGNYKFLDYTKFGFGLQMCMVAMSVLMGLATRDFYGESDVTTAGK